MAHVTGIIVVDAPASALNNAGEDPEARTENAIAVKYIRTPEGRYPYVSAQAARFWIRNTLAQNSEWIVSPVFREEKIAYTDAEPTLYAEDDLFGYMRAPSKSKDEKKAATRKEIEERSTPVDMDKPADKRREVTRISPLRIGTMVSVSPVWITNDFGVMARQEGNPVPHEHQFYRAHLLAPFSLSLSDVGTFYVCQKTGFRNLDNARIESAKAAGANEINFKGMTAYRLPLETRQGRVSAVLSSMGHLEGGAKQTLHLTDTAPSVIIFAVCKGGNHPFIRLFTPGDLNTTIFRLDVFEEVLRVFKDDFISGIYIGWSTGFLDAERQKLTEFVKKLPEDAPSITIKHPREIATLFAEEIKKEENQGWFE